MARRYRDPRDLVREGRSPGDASGQSRQTPRPPCAKAVGEMWRIGYLLRDRTAL